jgi:1-deoxy-D-xylulose-5-phosphate synthase
VAVLSIGPIGNNVTEAIAGLSEASEYSGLSVAHYDMRFLKPIDESILQEVAEKFKRIVTIENGVKTGGLGSAVIEWMNDHGYHPEIIRLGLPDTQFVEHGTVEELPHIVGLDAEAIRAAIIQNLSTNTQRL